MTELNKNHAMAYVQLAFCYMNQNQSQQAMESMKRAVACGKNRAQVFNHFGELCMAMGLFSDADMNFKKAEEADKDWAYSYVNEATYYLQTTQDYLKASDLLKKAIKIDPSCINAYLQLAQLHHAAAGVGRRQLHSGLGTEGGGQLQRHHLRVHLEGVLHLPAQDAPEVPDQLKGCQVRFLPLCCNKQTTPVV